MGKMVSAEVADPSPPLVSLIVKYLFFYTFP